MVEYTWEIWLEFSICVVVPKTQKLKTKLPSYTKIVKAINIVTEYQNTEEYILGESIRSLFDYDQSLLPFITGMDEKTEFEITTSLNMYNPIEETLSSKYKYYIPVEETLSTLLSLLKQQSVKLANRMEVMIPVTRRPTSTENFDKLISDRELKYVMESVSSGEMNRFNTSIKLEELDTETLIKIIKMIIMLNNLK